MKSLLAYLIRAYQIILSPFMGHHCRYYPTCSEYAIDAIEEHGPWQGAQLALRRILRCHPWHAGGADPVPPACHNQD
ncbi:MAG: putative membrane protein insertion efficiency factor [Halieaceae bacterium]|jgi:putative membrane protein insertion efficiency factor